MTEKILFWLNSDLSTFCMSHYFQKNYPSDCYAIIDVTNKPKKFFIDQNFTKFEKIWFYHDYIKKFNGTPDIDYLKKFEKNYNIDLWKIAVNERLFYRFNDFYKFSDNEILLILEQECKLFEMILNEVKPDFFITNVTALHNHHLFYELAKAKGVKILMLLQSKLGYKCILSNELEKFDFDNQLPKMEKTKRSFEEIREYIRSFSRSKQYASFTKNFANSKSQLFKAALNYLLQINNPINKTHYSYFGRNKIRVIQGSLSFKINKFFRGQFINRNLLRSIPKNEKFIYFPLHVDLERGLLIQTPFLTNQIEVIRNIAKSIPIEYKLFVKEHPFSVIRDWRKISDYTELLKIPNVRIFHPSVSSEELIKNSSLIITIEGSSGFEAAIYEKPSIVFTKIYYTLLPSVTIVNSFDDLPNAIRSSLKKIVKSSDVNKFLELLEENSFQHDSWGLDSSILSLFYYGGHLVDVEITNEKMNFFMQKNQSVLEKFALEHIKKIQQLKEYDNAP